MPLFFLVAALTIFGHGVAYESIRRDAQEKAVAAAAATCDNGDATGVTHASFTK